MSQSNPVTSVPGGTRLVYACPGYIVIDDGKALRVFYLEGKFRGQFKVAHKDTRTEVVATDEYILMRYGAEGTFIFDVAKGRCTVDKNFFGNLYKAGDSVFTVICSQIHRVTVSEKGPKMVMVGDVIDLPEDMTLNNVHDGGDHIITEATEREVYVGWTFDDGKFAKVGDLMSFDEGDAIEACENLPPSYTDNFMVHQSPTMKRGMLVREKDAEAHREADQETYRRSQLKPAERKDENDLEKARDMVAKRQRELDAAQETLAKIEERAGKCRRTN